MKLGNKGKTGRTEPAPSIEAVNEHPRRGGRPLTSFPLTVLTVVLVFTIGTFSFLAWQDWYSGKDHELLLQEAQVVHQLAGRLVHLDDAFMIPAPMAIASGDISWEERYHEVKAELDIELDEIGAKAIKIIGDEENMTRLKESKNVLSGLYERMFELVYEGNVEEARALLNGNEYQQVSKVFTESIVIIGQDLQAHVDTQLSEHKREGLVTFAMAGVAVPIILIVWVFAIRIVRNHIVLRKRAEDALRQSEERFRSLVANIPGMVYRCAMDRTWTMYHISDMVDSVTGYPASDFINNEVRDFGSIIHPDDREMVWQQVVGTAEKREAFNIEYRIIAADGSIKWILERGQVVSGENGNVNWLDGVMLDNTERKQAEEDLAQRILEMSAFNTLNEGVSSNLSLNEMVSAALDGVMVAAGPDLSLLFLREGEDLLLQDFRVSSEKLVYEKIVHHVDQCLCGMAARKGTAIYSRNIFEDVRCTGEECKKAGIHSLAALPLMSGDKVLGILAVGSVAERDFEQQASFLETVAGEISIGLQNSLLYEQTKRHAGDLKTANEELRSEIEERKRAEEKVINLAKFPSENPNPVLRVSRDGSLLYANEAADVVLKGWDVGVGGYVPEEWRQAIGEAFESSESVFKEEWMDGRFFSFGITAVMGAGYANLYGSDITKRKAAEDERERLMAMVTGTNRELESVVRVISHDLRAPLVNIHGFSNELVKDCQRVSQFIDSASISQEVMTKLSPVLEESVPQSLEYITKSAEKMDKLLGGLTHLSKVGKAKLKIQSLDVNEIVKSIVKTMQFQLREGGIAVKVDELPACRGDEVQINQVFSNLLNNAVKYLDPKRAGEIRVSGWVDEGRSVYRVDDNGVGIPPEHQGKIFELFHRLHPKGKVEGEGIGLSVVMRILDRLEGEIWVESEPGVGSSFFVSLPVGQA